jgi:uncharacterized repeat protein (TIGR03803 family)
MVTSSNPLQIGGDSIYGQYFQGTIDEVRVYARALSAAEIQSDMNLAIISNQNTVPTISPIADQVINEDTSSGAIALTVGDAESAAGSLTLSAGSSNPALVLTNNIVFGGGGGDRTVTISPASAQTGVATITVTVSDGTNSASAAFVLTVQTTPGLADGTCFGCALAGGGTVVRSFTIENIGGGVLTLDGTPNVAVSGPNAADFTVTLQPTSPVSSGGGSTTFQVTFAPGATGLRSATVSIPNDDADENPYEFAIQGTGVETIPLTISCPINVGVNADTGLCYATGVALGIPVASAHCGSVTVTSNAPAQFPVGTTVVTWTATDTSGDTNTCSQLVIVRDTQTPSITCPTDVTVNADTGLCYATGVALGIPVASAHCGDVTVTSNAPAQFPVGPTVVTWTATDSSGNTNACAQQVLVRGNPPVIAAAPESRTNSAGTMAAFSVSAAACPAPNYQWYLGPALLDGMTNSAIEIPSVMPVHAGSYSVVVSNLAGSATSAVATLTVTLPPQGVQLAGLCAFSASDDGPRNPYGRPVQAMDGTLYGTTCNGGSNDLGTVFELGTNGIMTSTLSFDNVNGASPRAGLLQAGDGSFYGTASSGGSGGGGTIFQATQDGALTALLNFDGANGSDSLASLVQASDGTLYGTAATGGASGGGTAFGFNTNSGLVLLSPFANTNGAQSAAGLLPSGRAAFYGTTSAGGSDGLGTIFRLGTNGSLTALFSFSGPDGATPEAALARGSDGNYYGTTRAGGSSNLGTIFQLTPGGALTTLVSFSGPEGADPRGELLQAADGNFYGTTWAGGAEGFGTVFRLTPSGALSTLLSFGNTNGANPSAGLLQGSDGNLYGTTVNGGPDGGGTVFRVTLDPRILTQPASLTTLAGATVSLNVLAQGTAPLTYQWQVNGINMSDGGNLSGTLSPTLTLTSVTTDQSGNYAVLVASPSGLVTSFSATLTVLPPGTIVISMLPDFSVGLSFNMFNTISNLPLRIEASADLLDWLVLTNIPDAAGTVQLVDLDATNHAQRFYRAVWTP